MKCGVMADRGEPEMFAVAFHVAHPPVECPRTGPLERGAGEVFLPAGHDNLALR